MTVAKMLVTFVSVVMKSEFHNCLTRLSRFKLLQNVGNEGISFTMKSLLKRYAHE